MQPEAQAPQRPKYTVWMLLLGLFFCCGLPYMIYNSIASKFVRAKETFQTPICLSNLRSLAAAQALYTVENDGHLPGEKWMDSLMPYLKENVGAIGCPGARNKTRDEYGFAMNDAIVGSSAAEISSTLPLFFDSSLLAKNAVGPPSTMPNPGRHRYEQDDDVSRQRDNNNVAFMDGSARSTDKRY